MLAMKGIAELVADTLRVADCLVYVSMGMPIYPVVDAAICDEFAQLRSERAINWATFEFIGHQFKRRNMVGRDNDMQSLTCCHTSGNKLATPLMFGIDS